jgi:hypothetical protein
MPFYPGAPSPLTLQEGAVTVNSVTDLIFSGGALAADGAGQATYTPPGGGGGVTRSHHIVSGSRAFNVVYTNSNTDEMEVSVSTISGSAGCYVICIVDGNEVCAGNTTGPIVPFVFSVPAGATYEVQIGTGSVNIQLWDEFY